MIEVSIAMALLAGVLLGVMEFNRIGVNANMSVQLDTDFASLSSSILYVLTSPKLCTEALGNGIDVAHEQPFAPMSSPTPSLNPMQVGTGGLPLTTIASLGALPGSITGITVTQLTFNKIYGKWVGASKDTYLANLYLEAQKLLPNGQPYMGAPILSRNFIVNLSVDVPSGKVISCN